VSPRVKESGHVRYLRYGLAANARARSMRRWWRRQRSTPLARSCRPPSRTPMAWCASSSAGFVTVQRRLPSWRTRSVRSRVRGRLAGRGSAGARRRVQASRVRARIRRS